MRTNHVKIISLTFALLIVCLLRLHRPEKLYTRRWLPWIST